MNLSLSIRRSLITCIYFVCIVIVALCLCAVARAEYDRTDKEEFAIPLDREAGYTLSSNDYIPPEESEPTDPLYDDPPAPPPPYEPYIISPRTWQPGEHPRILFTPAEIPALQAKVTTPGTISSSIWNNVKASSRFPSERSFFTAINASIIHALDDTGYSPGYGRAIVDKLKYNIVNSDDPPYGSEWNSGTVIRNMALVYDLCYDIMTQEERELFQEELLKIGSVVSVNGMSNISVPGNHSIVAAAGLGLISLALQSDVGETPRIYSDVSVKRSATDIANCAACDALPHWSSTNIITIGNNPGAIDYLEGEDYQYKNTEKGRAIEWIGSSPAEGSNYYVTYEFTPPIQSWKRQAQLVFKRSLESLFADGSYRGGILYGAWTMRWMLDFIEGLKRDGTLNLARHSNMKKFMKWFPYELRIGSNRYYNNLNDSHYYSITVNTFDAYMTWVRNEYRNDLENIDKLSLWYDARELNDEITDARLALWENDAMYDGTIPHEIPIETINNVMPASKHFKGRGLIYLRSGRWDLLGQTTNPDLVNDYALSFYAGSNTRSEHSNTDNGSFTLTALNRHFAIDNGYAQGNVERDPTAAHNYILVDGKGQPGPWSSTAEEPESAFGNFADCIYSDLKRSFIDTWPGNARTDKDRTRIFDYAERYLISIKGNDVGIPNYFAVIDELQKQDAVPGNYSWLLHTSYNIPISIGPQSVKLGGESDSSGVKPQLDLVVLSPEAVNISQDIWENNSSVSSHPRIVIEKNTVTDPRYFILMIPHDADQIPEPIITPISATGGVARNIQWADFSDTLIYRYKNVPAVTSPDVATDGKFAILRKDENGNINGCLLSRGKILSAGERDIIKAYGNDNAFVTISKKDNRIDISSKKCWLVRIYAPQEPSVFVDGKAVDFVRQGEYIIVYSPSYLEDLPNINKPVFEENFNDNMPDFFFHANFWPGFGKSTVNDGSFRLFGSDGLISYTYRQYSWAEPDATLIKNPVTFFGDSVISGKFRILSEDDTSGLLYLGFLTQDREFRYMSIAKQDGYRIAINPLTDKIELQKITNGSPETLSLNSAAVDEGNEYGYSIRVKNNLISFTLKELIGGTESEIASFEYEDPEGLITNEGYLQWSASGNLLVSLDDISVIKLSPARPLEIISITADNITPDSAEITWFTSTSAESQVLYGNDENYGFSAPESKNSNMYHKVVLPGLQSGTEYHFATQSIDSQGNQVLSQDMIFSTPLAENSAPEIEPVGDQRVSVGQRLNLWLNAIDENQDVLTFDSHNLPDKAILIQFNKTDINDDGYVNNEDFDIFKLCYGSSSKDDNYNGRCDFKHDNKIDLVDFAVFGMMYGHRIQESSYFNRSVLIWNPKQKDIGQHEVTIIASDSQLIDDKTFMIDVYGDSASSEEDDNGSGGGSGNVEKEKDIEFGSNPVVSDTAMTSQFLETDSIEFLDDTELKPSKINKINLGIIGKNPFKKSAFWSERYDLYKGSVRFE